LTRIRLQHWAVLSPRYAGTAGIYSTRARSVSDYIYPDSTIWRGGIQISHCLTQVYEAGEARSRSNKRSAGPAFADVRI